MSEIELPAPVAEMVDVADGLGTCIVQWDEVRYSLPAGTTFYTAEQARQAVLAERERCAKVCEERAGSVSMFANSKEASAHNHAVRGCAAAIRAG